MQNSTIVKRFWFSIKSYTIHVSQLRKHTRYQTKKQKNKITKNWRAKSNEKEKKNASFDIVCEARNWTNNQTGKKKNTNRNTTYMYACKFRFFCSGKSKICARGVSAAVAKDILSIEFFLFASAFVFNLWHWDGFRQSTISCWPFFLRRH